MLSLVTGIGNQLGVEVCLLLHEKGIDFIPTDRIILDITDKEEVEEFLKDIKPDVIFHCEDYTSVDAAEGSAKEKNYLINEIGTRNIAEGAKSINAKVVYISSDYVFDGTKSSGKYLETDEPRPINEFGKAKLLGERAIQNELSDFYIVRSSWIFGNYGKNFVDNMLTLSTGFDFLPAVVDEISSPTWTRNIAEFMLHLIENDCEYGIYHFSNEGTCNHFEFAMEILKETEATPTPVNSADFLPQLAKRPENSALDLSKAKATGFNIISWQDALAEMMKDAVLLEKVEEIPSDVLV